jgi:hypothetical protein
MAKASPITVIVPTVAAISLLCYLPLSKYLFGHPPQWTLFLFERHVGMPEPLPVIVTSFSSSFFLLLCTSLNLSLLSRRATVRQKNLPSTMSPEHVAAQRAYMRYHNMNPIYGISSKRARSADPDP